MQEVWTGQQARFADGALARLRHDQKLGLTPPDMDLWSATQVIVAEGAQAIVEHITGEDGVKDEVFARELAVLAWHGAFRRPEVPTSGGN